MLEATKESRINGLFKEFLGITEEKKPEEQDAQPSEEASNESSEPKIEKKTKKTKKDKKHKKDKKKKKDKRDKETREEPKANLPQIIEEEEKESSYQDNSPRQIQDDNNNGAQFLKDLHRTETHMRFDSALGGRTETFEEPSKARYDQHEK